MSNTVFAPLIKQWYERSQGSVGGKYTIFDSFISLWFSFNAWGSSVTGAVDDRRMIDALKQRNDLTNEYSRLTNDDAEFEKDVNRLAVFDVIDMRYPSRRDKMKTVNDTAQFGDVLEVIYQVRCNLFHGKKSMDDPHDKELVELSYRILTKLFRPIVNAIS